MKKILQILVLLLGVLMLPAAAHAQGIYGDVNGDQEVNIADVNAVIDIILDGSESTTAADVNGDGEINIADVNTSIDIILGGGAPSPDDHEYVDLGLPSGTMWATCNIGASSPEEFGDHYAWGETETKEGNYNWNNYKWCEGNEWSMTKYDPTKFWIYDEIELELADDAAYANWGPSWRMPSAQQYDELCNNCTWHWTTRKGVNGNLVTGPNGNSIFLPAAGYRSTTSVTHEGQRGYYWSRTVDYNQAQRAFNLSFESDKPYFYPYILGRCAGYTVRAVHVSTADERALHIKQQSLDFGQVFNGVTRYDQLTIINNTNQAVTLTVVADEPFMLKQGSGSASSITVEVAGNAIAPVTVMFTAGNPGDANGNVTFRSPALDGGQTVIPVHALAITGGADEHQYVNLGLPSGTLWATCNIGASSPEDYGDYFAWGETMTKDYYSWDTYKWYKSGVEHSGFTKYCNDDLLGYNGFVDDKTELGLADDAAYVNWGPSWRTPTYDQLEELYNYTARSWKQRNGVYGVQITGPNGNSIFLPAAGLRAGSQNVERGWSGQYWSTSIDEEMPNGGIFFTFYSEDWYFFYTKRCYGNTIRPVRATSN